MKRRDGKRRTAFRRTALILAAALGICACSSARTEAEPNRTDETVESKNRTVTVRLPSNPTTGFSWGCELEDGDIAQIVSDTYRQNNAPNGMVGVGGVQTFVFECERPGESDVTFTYRRPWEGGETGEVRRARLFVDETLRGTIQFF